MPKGSRETIKKRGRCDREMTLKIWEKPGEVLPYKGLMGTCSQPGYVFGDFCLKQGIDFINFCLKQAAGYLFLDDKQPARMFYELNYLQQNFYLLLSYTGYGFGLNVLNRVRV